MLAAFGIPFGFVFELIFYEERKRAAAKSAAWELGSGDEDIAWELGCDSGRWLCVEKVDIRF